MGHTFSRYLRSQIYAATLFVFVAFLGLFAFFDLIGELGELGQGDYRMPHVAAYVALLLPGHVYELFPIVVLIGTLCLRGLLPVLAVDLALRLQQQPVGLLSLIDGPLWLEITLAVLILDAAIYAQHRLLHRVPLLWQLHRVHHSDPVRAH